MQTETTGRFGCTWEPALRRQVLDLPLAEKAWELVFCLPPGLAAQLRDGYTAKTCSGALCGPVTDLTPSSAVKSIKQNPLGPGGAGWDAERCVCTCFCSSCGLIAVWSRLRPLHQRKKIFLRLMLLLRYVLHST